jgi:hypothetical protein
MDGGGFDSGRDANPPVDAPPGPDTGRDTGPRDSGVPPVDAFVPPPDSCVPAGESCNGMDDDCNGLIDDGLTRSCSTACGSGMETCAGGAWGACSARMPAVEVCNNVDDDCNGVVDGISRSCTGACGPGTQLCTDGEWKTCMSAATEVCNAVDDDCDGMIDEAGCPCPVVEWGGHTYQFCSATASWTSADSACRGGTRYDLVTISSSAENDFVQRETRSRSTFDWWIGLYQPGGSGPWSWSSGSSSSHRNWGPSEPNDTGDCARISPTDGRWYDWYCSSGYRYVCEGQ